MGLILFFAIICGILLFIRKLSIDKYTQKQELAAKILEIAFRESCGY